MDLDVVAAQVSEVLGLTNQSVSKQTRPRHRLCPINAENSNREDPKSAKKPMTPQRGMSSADIFALFAVFAVRFVFAKYAALGVSPALPGGKSPQSGILVGTGFSPINFAQRVRGRFRVGRALEARD